MSKFQKIAVRVKNPKNTDFITRKTEKLRYENVL